MRDARSAEVAALGIAACVALGWLSLAAHAPPRPRALDAPADGFSAARAAATVEALAAGPRPSGSAAHRDARQFLVERLEGLGLEVELEEATVLRFRDERLLGSRVVNVLARLPAREPSPRRGAILLMAHYDTVPGSPGAGDDASGVAAIVEAVRALAAGTPLARDVWVLLTDGEEPGLLGARAFVRDRDRLGDVALVLNFEARGSGGAVSMFESSSGNHRLVEELARAAPRPVASSLSYEVYRRMPNDTDFSILRRAGLVGFNFAMIGRYPSYHTRLDGVARLAAGSVQHHGSYAVALARHFSELERVPAPGAEGVYFNLFGSARRLFVSYSGDTARVLAILLTALAAVALTARSRRHRGRVAGAGWGVALSLGAAIGGLAAPLAIWRGQLLLAPGLRRAPHGVPWNDDWLALAGLLLTLALVAALVRLLGGVAEAADLWAGVLVVWTLAAVATSFFVAGASYVFLWPAASGWAGLLAAERLSGSRRWRAAVAAAAALPAVAILAPVVGQLLEALTVRLAAPAMVLVAWLATLLVVPLAELATWGRNWVETGVAAAAVAILTATALSAGFGPATPATSALFYLVDADLGRASWISTDRQPSSWAAGFVDREAESDDLDGILSRRDRRVWSGTAPPLDLLPPVVDLVGGGEAVDSRRIVLRLSSPRGAPVLLARLTAATPFRVTRVDGERPPPELPAAAAEGARELRLLFFAAPPAGIDLELVPGDGPIEARLVDQTYGLPEVGGAVPARPPGLIPPASWTSDSTFVSRRVVWPAAAEGEVPRPRPGPSEIGDG